MTTYAYPSDAYQWVLPQYGIDQYAIELPGIHGSHGEAPIDSSIGLPPPPGVGGPSNIDQNELPHPGSSGYGIGPERTLPEDHPYPILGQYPNFGRAPLPPFGRPGIHPAIGGRPGPVLLVAPPR